MSNVTGINSGPMPPENGMMKIFTIMVNDTKPMWMYCATADHCQKGMVMAINPPATGERNLQAFKAAAAQVPASGGNSTAPGNGTAPGTPEGAAADGQAAEGVAASSMVNLVVGSTGIVAFVAATFALLL